MSAPYFFGYGSLVNRRTHSYPDARKARVAGWRRAWRKSPLRQRPYLTVVPDPGSEVLGLVAKVPGADWAALDDREHAYERRDVTGAVTHQLGAGVEVALYALAAAGQENPGEDHPLVLSYIDAVVQGYLVEYGIDGVGHFFATTSGWHVPVLDDRAHPIYARAQVLNMTERDVVDEGLAAVGARVVQHRL
ncbi:MAG: gamma-glutamylcyclotransferase [Maritimibacter sp.]|nr:gamma-glutamylcyclotransferase [Maritimibacter sp.]